MKVLVFYVSGHGLGHAARVLGVLNAIPQHIDVHIKTASPFWFWQGEACRPFHWHPGSVDGACYQRDPLHSDGPETLRQAVAVHQSLKQNAESELQFLRRVQADLLLSDVGYFPLALAKKLDIPGLLMGNFTWLDIYSHYVQGLKSAPLRQEAEHLLDEMTVCYQGATLLIKTGLAMDFLGLDDVPMQEVQLVARNIHLQREEVREALKVEAHQKLVVLAANGMMSSAQWDDLADPKIRFVSYQVSEQAAKVVQAVPYPKIRSQDLTNAADVVIAKAGYGTLVECMSTGTPLIYPPRYGFDEHRFLVGYMKQWGAGVSINMDAYQKAQLQSSMQAAEELVDVKDVEAKGAKQVGAILARYW